MIGLALVAFVTVFAAGLKSSVAQAIDDNFHGEIVIQNTDGFSPIPPAAATAARSGARASDRSRRSAPRSAKLVGGGQPPTSRAPTRERRRGARTRLEAGRAGRPCAALRAGEAIVDDGFAASNDLDVGDRFRAPHARPGAGPSFRVVGEVDAKLDLLGSVLVTQRGRSPATSARPRTLFDFVDSPRRAPTPDSVQALLENGAETAFPTAEVLNQQELKESQREPGQPAARPVYVLLSLAVIVSPLRDRQHAGALDPRAHPRARDAAGDRHVAAPGADA